MRRRWIQRHVFPTVYFNGAPVYQNVLASRLGKDRDTIRVKPHSRKNILAARGNHEKWQWAVSLELAAEGFAHGHSLPAFTERRRSE